MITAVVIDDSIQMADSLCQMLTLLDIRAQAAYGARAAMVALNEVTPDIIFLDINMPALSGFEILAYLRREPRLYNVPVVIVTSDDQAETAHRAKEAGAMLVLIKPMTYETLEDALRQCRLLKS